MLSTDKGVKLSIYNLIVDESATELNIWNTKRGSIVKLEKHIYDKLAQGCFNGEVAQYIDTLLKEGIVVPQNLNEQQEIIFRARQRQYSTGRDSLGFVVAPTLACNFCCPYCFEHGIDRKGTMSSAVQEEFVECLRNKINDNLQIKNVRITWFGGEPLLAFDKVIVPLQRALIELCSKQERNIHFSIITNGYYLTEEKYDFLFKEGRTKFVQITLDGSEKEYVKRKGTKPEAFYKVVNNILNLSEYLHNNSLGVKLNIRLNADNANYANIKDLILNLKKDERFHDNINFSLERLREYDQCQSLTDYCTTDEFENLKYDFEDFIGQSFKFPEPKTVFCGQHCMNVFCIGPNGEVYKCEHDLGIPEHIIGNIKTGLSFNKYFLEFMDQPLPQKCLSCSILPVCMGGCPHRRFSNDGDVECDFTVANLIKSVKRFILKKEV